MKKLSKETGDGPLSPNTLSARDSGTGAGTGDGPLSPLRQGDREPSPVSPAPPVIAVCGVKNSGKTTLLAGLVNYFSEQGLKVAVIKHDGHDFSCDVPGTDSYRLHEAGAYGTAVYSSSRIFLHKETTAASAQTLISLFPEADIIFVEGVKDSPLPKIEVIRREISDHPASCPEGRFLIATDWEEEHFTEPTANLNDIPTIAERIKLTAATGPATGAATRAATGDRSRWREKSTPR